MLKSDEEIERLIKSFSLSIRSLINPYQCQKNGIDQDDLVQEVRIRIWKAYTSNGHHITHFYAYLKKVVDSVFINEIHKRHRDMNLVKTFGNLQPLCDCSLEKEREAGQHLHLKTILNESLKDIKESQKIVVQLRLSGLSLEEIAGLNQWTYRKTCNLYYRGLKSLKHRLEKRGIVYEN
jgi:RNA polymerase sigma factor (sigma-70 family)